MSSSSRCRRGPDRGRDRRVEGQGRRHDRDQRRHRRDRDRQVAGRAALALRGHRPRAARRRGRDRPGRHPDHLDRRRGRGRPRPPPRPRPSRPSPTPTSGWREKAGEKAGAQVDPTDIDLSNPAASGSMEGASLVGRIKAERGPMRRARRGSASPSTEAGAQTQLQVQGAFSPGGAQSQDVLPADESPVPAVDQRPGPAAAPAEALVPSAAQAEPSDVRALAKPPVRKLAKDLGRRPDRPDRLRPVGLDHPRRRPGCRVAGGSRLPPLRHPVSAPAASRPSS